MKCLETRTLEDGLILKMFEVPESIWNSIVQQGRMKDRPAQAMSVAMPLGSRKRAAAPVASVEPLTPAVPASVVTSPAGVILRMVSLSESAT